MAESRDGRSSSVHCARLALAPRAFPPRGCSNTSDTAPRSRRGAALRSVRAYHIEPLASSCSLSAKASVDLGSVARHRLAAGAYMWGWHTKTTMAASFRTALMTAAQASQRRRQPHQLQARSPCYSPRVCAPKTTRRRRGGVCCSRRIGCSSCRLLPEGTLSRLSTKARLEAGMRRSVFVPLVP